jgi:DNA-binding NarL/FixJ family response regulator
MELAWDCGAFRGPAEAGGWVERAGRLLEGLPPGEEQALLLYMRARRRLGADRDPAEAAALASRAAELAHAVGRVDGELACRALQGLALVAGGDVDPGMRLLDEAATGVVSGEVADRQIVGSICCNLIEACQQVRDFDRAGEWCRRVHAIAETHGDESLFASCRTLYGEVLVWQGAWAEAERTLDAVRRDLTAAGLSPAGVLVQLAELRRRQGRAAEAAALLDEAGGHRRVPIVRAHLALDSGRPREAAREAERFLRRHGDADRLERVSALEVLVQARLALGQADAAATAAELDEVAAVTPTPPLRAAALLARARVLAARDREAARAALEDAVDLYAASDLHFEAAQARVELAAALRELGWAEAAVEQAALARADLAWLGAAGRDAGPVRDRDTLTAREREVLRMLARGRSNEEIASELVVSVRTVESHVAGAYRKIGVGGRTARAAATAYVLASGLD